MSVEDKNSAVETVSREKATNDPGSVGAPMSGVVVEVRVKEGQEIKKGDPLCSTFRFVALEYMGAFSQSGISRDSPQRHEGELNEVARSCGPGLTPILDGICRDCPRFRTHQTCCGAGR